MQMERSHINISQIAIASFSHRELIGHTQNQIGKSYFEMSDFNNSKQTLEHVSKLEPHRMQVLDMVSAAS